MEDGIGERRRPRVRLEDFRRVKRANGIRRCRKDTKVAEGCDTVKRILTERERH